MKLESVRVENFKSIDDSNPFKVASLTSLVGKNEAGKSAILEAMYKFNPVVATDGKFEPAIEFYPRRRWNKYKDQHETNPDRVLTTVWQIEADDAKAVNAKLGVEAFSTGTVTILKGYDNKRRYADLSVDESAIVKRLVAEAGLHHEEAALLNNSVTVQTVRKALGENASKSERETAFLASLTKTFAESTPAQVAANVLDGRLPKFIYFNDYDRLPGQVPLTALVQKQQTAPATLSREERIFLALLDLAGTDADDIQTTGKFEELKAALEAIQNSISDEIFEYWSQNKDLRVDFSFDHALPSDAPPFNTGWIFRTRIENTRHRASVPFERRSTGFIWFFSFLVWFSQLRKEYGDRLLVLLDEPGLTLHGRAQGDLLRYMKEKLVSPNTQVIYSTHSPFMVDPDNLLSVRTVEDVTENDKVLGTKVGDEVLSTDADTIFPLQAALGYDITQTLFVGKHPLLVEGPSDLLLLKWFSRQLKIRNRTALDPRWTISPSGGIDKMASFVTLFRGKSLDIAVLSDFHPGDKNKVQRMRESGILKTGRVLTVDTYAGQGEADIEDMLGRQMYVALVNQTYDLKDKRALPATAPADASKRVADEVKKHVDLVPDAPIYDHYDPAAFLTENYSSKEKADLLPGINEALDRFEKLFKDLNAMLE